MVKTIFFALVIVISFPPSTWGQGHIPDWAKDAVWYQIFPERFRNGDPTNDPTRKELQLGAERDWEISPWTSDWYQLQPWEASHNRNFYDNVYQRRYGGDMQGIIDKLDYLAGLGITAIYLNPVFEAYSLHKYDASTYHHIDNNFGSDAKGDLELMAKEDKDAGKWQWSAADKLFLKLIRQAHKRGIRIIIDGVFNHSGTRFWAFQDVVKNQQKSRYADWFDVIKWDNPATAQNEFDYKGWWGHKSLPEFREDKNGLVKGPRDYFFNVTRRWMDPDGDGDPNDGIDGWRLDVANEVGQPFWRQWRKLVKSINPQAYIVGEIWDDAAKWLAGDQFDAVMNYRFARASVRFFIDTGQKRYRVSDFTKQLADVRSVYPTEVNYVLQNLYDSHDTDRLVSMIINKNRSYDRDAGPRQNPGYNVRKPSLQDRRIQKLMVLFQMTYLGAPMIYYGDEAGMWGADDPDDRKPMLWADLKYDNEHSHPIPGQSRPNDTVIFDRDLYEYYRKLIHIRKSNIALRRGSLYDLLIDDEKCVYAFGRKMQDNHVIVVLNNDAVAQTISLPVDGTFQDQISGNKLTGDGEGLKLRLDAKSGVILVKQ